VLAGLTASSAGHDQAARQAQALDRDRLRRLGRGLGRIGGRDQRQQIVEVEPAGAQARHVDRGAVTATSRTRMCW